MSGLIDMPSATESGSYFQPVTMSDSRDFSRPRESEAIEQVPDLNLAEDDDKKKEGENKAILSIKKFLASSYPGFPKYTGNVNDPEVDTNLISTLNQIQNILSKDGFNLSPVSGSSLNFINVSLMIATMGTHFLKKNKKEDVDISEFENNKSNESAESVPPGISKKINPEISSATVQAYQQLFSNELPGVGKVYSGSVNGDTTKETIQALGAAALKVESFISKAIGNVAAGSIFNWFNFKMEPMKNPFMADPGDIRSALEYIFNFQNKTV